MRKKQLELSIGRGGYRPGAGRKRIHSKGVAHRVRERVTRHTPMHINFKYRVTIKNKFCLKLLKKAILNARNHGLKVIHFSLQHNHVHLIVESGNNEALSAGMRSLTVTFAKGLGKGRIQLGRYHLHVLKTLRETRNAVHYVLFNEQKHGGRRVGEFSSILQMENALTFIKDFCIRRKVMLTIGRKSNFDELSQPWSYLMKESLNP